MLINFRQGIINAQTNFLQLVNGAVNIYVNADKVDLAFAYGSHNYLFTESQQVNGAWTNLPSAATAYLYWDINIVTGVRTFGFTTVAPSFGSVFPTSPVVNQHYYNFSTNKMYYWTGVLWSEVLRVFAGTVQNNAILTAYNIGSQVNLYGNYNIGYILYSQQNIALRVQDASGIYYFLTTEDEIYTQKDQFNAYKIDALLMDGKAIEPIPAFSCVTWKGPKQLGLASYVNYQYPCIGIAVEVSGVGDVKQFVTKGFITNYGNWNWTQAPNTDLFVGQNGEITTSVPQQYSLQKIGHIVSPNTIYVNIDELVLIETIQTSLTPSVTPTMSQSLSVTPTATFTPTPTVTASPTPTITPTITPTSTLFNTPVTTVTASVTPSITPSITTSITVTPTVSVTSSVSITPSVTPSSQGGTVSPTPTPTPSLGQASPTPTPSSGAAQYDPTIEADAPDAYWPLNTDLTDVIHGDNLVYPTSPEGVDLIADAYGHYLYFDSPSSGLNFTTPISLTNTFSLEAWIEVEAFSAAPPSDNYFTVFGTDIYGLQFDQTGVLYVYGDSDEIYPVVSGGESGSSFAILPNTVYHVVVTVDGSGNVIFYFNGTPYLGSSQLTETYDFQYLGTDNSQEYFYGMIGNPAIYNSVLTQEQINTHYNVGINNYRYGNSIILPTPSVTPTLPLESATTTPTPSPTVTPSITPSVSVAPADLVRLDSTGAQDNSFTLINTLGQVVTGINQISSDYIYFVGNFTSVNGNSYSRLARLTSAGTLDTSFVGLQITNTPYAIYPQTDGHIYIGGGISYDSSQVGLIRLNSDGSFDSTFNFLPITFTFGSTGCAIILPTSGNGMLLVGVFTLDGYSNIARLNSDGTLDTTFTAITISGTDAEFVTAINTVDGHTYIGGNFTEVNGVTGRSYLIRLNSDGTLDTTFTDLGLTSEVSALLQSADGHIYVGNFENNLIRLNSDGTIDNTYSSPISIAPSFLYQTNDGHIYFTSFSANMARLNSDGSLDTTYTAPLGLSGAGVLCQTADGNIYVGD